MIGSINEKLKSEVEIYWNVFMCCLFVSLDQREIVRSFSILIDNIQKRISHQYQ